MRLPPTIFCLLTLACDKGPVTFDMMGPPLGSSEHLVRHAHQGLPPLLVQSGILRYKETRMGVAGETEYRFDEGGTLVQWLFLPEPLYPGNDSQLFYSPERSTDEEWAYFEALTASLKGEYEESFVWDEALWLKEGRGRMRSLPTPSRTPGKHCDWSNPSAQGYFTNFRCRDWESSQVPFFYAVEWGYVRVYREWDRGDHTLVVTTGSVPTQDDRYTYVAIEVTMSGAGLR